MQPPINTSVSELMENEARGSAAAVAHPNIALVKYWGKRDGPNNAPAVGSLSITLDTLETRTSVQLTPHAKADTFILNGSPADAAQCARLTRYIDRLRQISTKDVRVAVRSTNNFPTGAGLASSASGFAALALAASRALDVSLDARALSNLARAGSGSAARSVFGGFVELTCGHAEDGHDAVAAPLHPAEHWPLRVIVAITNTATKDIGSTEGMERTRRTAPYWDAWVTGQEDDLGVARRAVAERDFNTLADVSEHSCLKMHALAMAAKPPLMYWNPSTLAAMQKVLALRQDGLQVFFTVDAGPQVKAVCLPADAAAVHDALAKVPGVQSVMNVGLGPGAKSIAFDQGL